MLKRLVKKCFLYKNLFIYRKNCRISKTAILQDNTRVTIRNNRNDNCLIIKDCSIVDCEFYIESDIGNIEIGERCFINAGTKIISCNSVKVDDDVMMGWGITIVDHNAHSLDSEERKKDIKQKYLELIKSIERVNGKNWSTVNSAPIHICSKAWIGFDAVIMKGVTIGEGAVVAARSVVTHDVEPYTVVAGNPARYVKHIE